MDFQKELYYAYILTRKFIIKELESIFKGATNKPRQYNVSAASKDSTANNEGLY